MTHEKETDIQGRQSGLKSGGAQRGGAGNFGVFSPKKPTYIYILSGRGRKSGGARALLAPPRMAPLLMMKIYDFFSG